MLRAVLRTNCVRLQMLENRKRCVSLLCVALSYSLHCAHERFEEAHPVLLAQSSSSVMEMTPEEPF